MKSLLILATFSLSASVTTAQSYKVTQCVIENGSLKTVSSDYDPATGNYSITVNGIKKSFNAVYPEQGSDYAASASWYVNNETITVTGKKFVKYGLPRILSTTDVEKLTVYNRIGVYVEAGLKGAAEVIYIPVRRGCEFQPYQQQPGVVQKTIYYDENWKITSANDAAYYRLVKINAAGKPVGLVTDYYADGRKQWQGHLSYIDAVDNNKDVMEGVCAWFHSNGTKIEEAYYVKGKQQGVYKRWTEEGHLEQEIEYKNGVVHGYVKTYSAEGNLLSTEHYTNGKPNTK